MRTSSAKAKGRTLQGWVRDIILSINPELMGEDVRNTSSGAQGEDVQLSPAARELIPMQIECKNLARHAVYKHYEQASTHGNHEPLLIIKQNRSKPLAVVDAAYYFELLRKANR